MKDNRPVLFMGVARCTADDEAETGGGSGSSGGRLLWGLLGDNEECEMRNGGNDNG